MIVTKKQADDAWGLLRQWARMSDERWDDDAMVNPDGRSAVEINDAFRAAARYCHPDSGGNPADFVAVDRAKHVMFAWQERLAKAPPPEPDHGITCARCEGKGYVEHQRAFRAMRVTCPRCKGSGALDVEVEKGDFR